MNLPELDGFQVLKALKEHLGPAMPPVMMLTARNAETDFREALRPGAKDYLTRPFEDANLLRRVARLIRMSAASDKARPGIVLGA